MATEKRLIDASKLLNKYNLDCKTAPERYIALVEAPTVDAVSRGVHDQVRWERDVAIEQLESYGVSLGEKADVVKVVRCEKCTYRSQYADENGNYKCGGILTEDEETALMVKPDFFCAYGERRGNGK